MSAAFTSAICSGPNPGDRGLSEKPYPGIDGATTWNASSASPPWATGSVNGPMILVNSAIEPGQAIKAVFRKQPLFIRRLTPAEIAEANAVSVGSLRDPQTLADRTQEGHEDMLVTMGVCTHLGCVPLGAAEGEVKGEFGGYFCPCHGSHYDTAGRIRKGPAPTNLEVPEYTFTSDTVIQVG